MPVPQLINSVVGWASCPLFVTGKMPVPQLINSVVGWASCPLFVTGKMPVPQLMNSLVGGILPALCNRQDACSTINEFFYIINLKKAD
jgi:hypothetical protein